MQCTCMPLFFNTSTRDNDGTYFREHFTGSKKCPNTAIRWSPDDAFWVAATERDELSNEYFARQANSLEQRGLCIMEGFMSDKNVPKGLTELLSCGVNSDVLEEISNFVLESFPGEEALKDEANCSVWNPIVNAGERDEDDREKGIGRFITTLQAFITKRETESTWVAVRRALLDVRLGYMRAAIRMVNGMDGKPEMAMPVTGGSFLCTSEGFPRQELHTELEVNKQRHSIKVPGYFAVCTGQYEAHLRDVLYYHKYLCCSSGEIRVISNAVKAKKIWIPPYSVFFGRGDICHAGHLMMIKMAWVRMDVSAFTFILSQVILG